MTAVAPSMFIGTGRVLPLVQRGLDRERGTQVIARPPRRFRGGLADHRQQRVTPRVDRVEAVPEPGYVPRPRPPRGQHPRGGGVQVLAALLGLRGSR